MKSLIIGTAGHVDHGKTQLVKALTGTDTDRLKEEKERGISIDLGFAFLDLPGGRRAGIVDVPGHERFIKNMLAGVGGIDIVILVIAADEGIMPQTQEHLDIIQLLQIKKGIVVLTKIDLVDQEWLDLVREEVREFLNGTLLEEAELLEVSSLEGRGIQELKSKLAELAESTETKSTGGPMRLMVDRVFSVVGFGTVVTGTLVSGAVGVGDLVEIMPQRISSRIRSVHVHGKKIERAVAGQRVAVNLAGVEVEQIPRGSVVASPGHLKPAFRLDVRLVLLQGAKPLKNRSRVRIYLGTSEIFGRVRLLDREELEPGHWAYLQLELEHQAVAVRGDRFVIRSYSPMRTIGGGTVIEAGAGRHKKYRKEVMESISTKERGTPEDLVEELLNHQPRMMTASEISRESGFEQSEIMQVLQNLEQKDRIKHIQGEGINLFLSKERYLKWSMEVQQLVKNHHQEFPLREGFPKEELRSRKFSNLNSKEFQLFLQSLEREQVVKAGSKTVSHPDYVAQLPIELEKKLAAIRNNYHEAAFKPPSWEEAVRGAGVVEPLATEILHYFISQGILVKVTEEIVIHKLVLEDAKNKLTRFFQDKKEITVAEARDIFNTSRKFALPLLEYFDRERVTRRVGDVRVQGTKLK